MARPDSWMPMYWADYWGDANGLTAAQHGAYLNLIGRYWRDSGLPNDDGFLQRASTMGEREWKANRSVIIKFFAVDGDRLVHSRIDRELIKAKAAYEKRRSAAEKTNANRDANRDANRSGDRDADRSVTHNSHSPNGEKHPSDVLPAKPRKRFFQMPADWKPDEQDSAHAADKGLDAKTISNLGEQCRDHHIAKGTAIKDLHAVWRTWVGNHINWHGTGAWPRPDAGRPKTNLQPRSSVDAAANSILAKAGFSGRSDNSLHPDGGARPERNPASEGGSGPIIDAHYRDGSFGITEGTEVHDAPDTGHHGRFGRPTDSLPEAPEGLPSGRGSVRPDEPQIAMVAHMGGVGGAIGDADLSPPDDAGSFADAAFLKTA